MLPGLGIRAEEAGILLLIRRSGSLRFSEVEKATGKNPAQVDRWLKNLTKEFFLVAETEPAAKGRPIVRYTLTKRGDAATRVIDTYIAGLRRHERELGTAAVEEAVAVLNCRRARAERGPAIGKN